MTKYKVINAPAGLVDALRGLREEHQITALAERFNWPRCPVCNGSQIDRTPFKGDKKYPDNSFVCFPCGKIFFAEEE